MKNYLNFEADIKTLENELDKLRIERNNAINEVKQLRSVVTMLKTGQRSRQL